jgi:polysaccharide export outer membrane protein
MRKLIYPYIILGLLLIFSSCSTRQYQVLFQQKDAVNDSTYHDTGNIADYRIKSQDILQIRNLQDGNGLFNTSAHNDLKSGGLLSNNTGGQNLAENQDFRVEEDGTVILPAIGRVKVAGYTRAGAQTLIEDAYRKSVFVNPIIELKIVSLKVIIFGEIKAQGSFPIVKDQTTLVEMIGQAGGITDKANEKNVKIIRGTEKNPKVISVDLSNIASINDPKSVLQNGDIIYISQNKRATRSENFQNFSSSIFQPLLLFFNTMLIIFTLTRR